MASNLEKKLFFLMFCLASVLQGMYSTYFVSILTTIERIYQIPSRTAGAIMSATELGQIFGSLLIAYYGGKGNKAKWLAACMTLTASAALISTSPHFMLRPNDSALKSHYDTSDLNADSALTLTSPKMQAASLNTADQLKYPTKEQLCYRNPNNVFFAGLSALNLTQQQVASSGQTLESSAPLAGHQHSSSSTLVIFFMCLLAIGFGSTAITTLGIPFIDDIVSTEDTPLYLGLTIGLRIFGPALGFLLGSVCINLDASLFLQQASPHPPELGSGVAQSSAVDNGVGAWWLGQVIISLPLLVLALPMYLLSRSISSKSRHQRHHDRSDNEFEGITYQAAEDHDIGGSRDFQTHVLTICDLDVTSNQTCYSEVDSSSREVLQANHKSDQGNHRGYNFGKNLTLERPILTKESILYNNDDKQPEAHNNQVGADEEEDDDDDENDDVGAYGDSRLMAEQKANQWRPASCLVVNHFGRLESTSFTNDEAKSLQSSSSSSRALKDPSPLPSPTPTMSSSITSSARLSGDSTMDLFTSLSRLIKNRLLLLRMLSAILHILPIAGFYTFFPKYLSEQFRIAPSSASAISGLAGILFVGLGAFSGGMIVRLLNVNSRLMTRWIATSALLYSIGMLILMNLGCPENQTIHYRSLAFESTDCLSSCHCSHLVYSPVCANETTFISPCLAGCKSYKVLEGRIIFDDCGCTITPNITTAQPAATNSEHINLNVATKGHCLIACDNLKWYIIVFSIFTLIHASSEVGSMMFNLRCVQSSDRTLALGLITFTSSLLGTIPCSVIYGTLIDLTCVHWDTLMSHIDPDRDTRTQGACRAYENDQFRFNLHATTALVMFFAFLVDCIVCGRAKEVDFYDRNSNSKSESPSKSEVKLGHENSTETI